MVLFGSGFRAAPLTATACLLLQLIASTASVSYTIGLRMMVDGATRYARPHGGEIAIGVALVAVLFTLGWLLSIISASESSLLTDRVNLALGVRIARVASSTATLEHLERPDMLARLDQLTSNRRTLAGAPGQLFRLIGQALRAILTVVLLATIYLPLIAVPLLALIPAWAQRRAARIEQQSDNELAEDRRLIGELFSLATSAASARELRTYGVTEALSERHAELTETVRRRSVRSGLREAAWEAAGWLVFAAGLVAAIVLLVLRAAHGKVTPGQVVQTVSLLRRSQGQISSSTDTAGTFNTARLAAGQLLWLEDHARALQGAAAQRPPRRLERGIELQGLEFAYPGKAGERVLGPLDLELPAGRCVALVGENGAGKTTLVKLLCALYRPTAGGYSSTASTWVRSTRSPGARR